MVFTGRATYDTGVFNGLAEDVADIISMISPFETPLLDRLGDGPNPATNVLHEWLEDELNPNTIVSSGGVDGTTTATSLEVHVGGSSTTAFLQAGAVVEVERTGEYIQITGTSGEFILFTRAFGGTSADTITFADNLFLISDAALEGADVTGDISRARSRPLNYTQIFKKDVIVSGTELATTKLGGIANELDYQRTQRLRESIRDLEKATIRGKLSGNTLGSSSAYRTMRGVLDFISTNSFSTGTLTESWLGSIVKSAWDNGASDLDLIVADANYKRIIDSFNSTRQRTTNTDQTFRQLTSFYESTFGQQEVMLNRWMPANSLMVISTQRINVVPLQGRSFSFEEVSRTGDSTKGMVLGEYTVELMNEAGMAQAFGG